MSKPEYIGNLFLMYIFIIKLKVKGEQEELDGTQAGIG